MFLTVGLTPGLGKSSSLARWFPPCFANGLPTPKPTPVAMQFPCAMPQPSDVSPSFAARGRYTPAKVLVRCTPPDGSVFAACARAQYLVNPKESGVEANGRFRSARGR